jgi:hypothetical protein
MIYCEAIPNTTEAILVIVKSGSVYLDGSFQIDSIPEELLIFKSQTNNNFSVFIHGNVPISQTEEEGKIAFDADAVKSFEVLSEPAFPTLPTVRTFQLQLLDVVLNAYGIGALPIKKIVIVVGSLLFVYFAYDYIASHKKVVIPTTFIPVSNPYQAYTEQLASPDPAKLLHNLVPALNSLYSIVGWAPGKMTFTPGEPSKLRVGLLRAGGSVESVLAWGSQHGIKVEILTDGLYVNLVIPSSRRDAPKTITSLQSILSTMMDRMLYVMPSTPIQLTAINDRKVFSEADMTMVIPEATPVILDVISTYIAGMPLVLTKADFQINDGYLSGTLTFKALGN